MCLKISLSQDFTNKSIKKNITFPLKDSNITYIIINFLCLLRTQHLIIN